MSEELNDEILGNLLFVERTPKLEIAKFIFNLSDSLDKVNSNNRMFAESYAENYKELLDIQKERNQLKIENERLKEALKEIANSADADGCGYTSGEGHSDCVWKARKVLKEVTNEQQKSM